MPSYFSLVLHAHLPFVRHPEHEKFLEESWFYEAVTETYLPLVQMLAGWQRDGVNARLTLTLTPTLCAMLGDGLLRERYTRHLENLIALAEKEIRRTRWDKEFAPLADYYHRRFLAVRETWSAHGHDLVGAFRKFQDAGLIEIITCAATHALLPLLADHPPALRAQILTARDQYRSWFGRDPRGIWLPECAYVDGLDRILQEANIRWFITDTHGLIHARPRPHYGVFAPVFTPHGIAAFARDRHSAEQVWSRDIGYPGDPRYRDFYRDIGFDLDHEYVKPCLPTPHLRGFTGLKYYAVTGKTGAKHIYDPAAALRAADDHATHFLHERLRQFARLAKVMDRPAHIVAPYDAELFGHWWHEGLDFLNYFVRKAVYDQKEFVLTTPTEYLRAHPTQQIATPAASSWGEEGHWRVWLNDANAWIYPHLRIANERMTELARCFRQHGGGVQKRALKQAARELMLAQASDWPFILRSGTSPDYARARVEDHLLRFTELYEQISGGKIIVPLLEKMEATNNIFPNVNYRYWV